MGRKLEDWERSKRDRNQEYERQERSLATEERRLSARLKKEESFQANYSRSKQIVKDWEDLYYAITNLQVSASHNLKSYDSIFEWISELVPNKIPLFKRKIKVVSQSEFTSKTFFPHESLKKAKNEVEYSINDYCKVFGKTYIPFLDFLFSGIKESHKNFIEERRNFISIEEKRKNEYLKLLKDYEVKEHKHILRLKDEELIIKKNYEDFANNLKIKIQETGEVIKKLKIDFTDITQPLFYHILLSKLPLDFSIENEDGVNSLDDDDLKWNLKSDILGVGLGILKSKTDPINVYIILPEDHFPIKDKQLVLLKETHSERPLTIKQKEEIESNFYPSLAISYSHYFFKFSIQSKVNIHLLLNGVDPGTGQKTNLFYKGYQFDRETFESLNLEAIVPSESVKKFKTIKNSPEDTIIWSHNTDTKPKYKDKVIEFLYSNPVIIPNEYSEIGEIGFPEPLLIESIEFIYSNNVKVPGMLDAYELKEEFKLDDDETDKLIQLLVNLKIIDLMDLKYDSFYLVKLWDNDKGMKENLNKLISILDKQYDGLLKLREKILGLQKSTQPFYEDEAESGFIERLREKDSGLADIWSDYGDKTAKSMYGQKEMLQRYGMDTSHIDEIIKKYGLKNKKSFDN